MLVGVVFQMPNQPRPEFPDIVPDLADVVAEAVQLGDQDLVSVGLAVAVPAGEQRPRHNNDQDADGSDNLGQPCHIRHRYSFSKTFNETPARKPTNEPMMPVSTSMA